MLPLGDFGLDVWDPGHNIMFNCVRECVEPKTFLHVDKIKPGTGSIIDCCLFENVFEHSLLALRVKDVEQIRQEHPNKVTREYHILYGI